MKCIKLLFFSIFLVAFTSTSLQAQCTLVCNDNVQVSSNTGYLSLEAPETMLWFLEGDTCPLDQLIFQAYESIDDFQTNTPVANLVFEISDPTSNYYYSITDTTSSNSCWGTFEIDFNTSITLICPPEVTIDSLHHLENPVLTGTIVTNPDNAGPLDGYVSGSTGEMIIEFSDKHSCTNNFIERTYTFSDEFGNYATCVQIIHIAEITNGLIFALDDIYVPSEVILNCDESLENIGQPEITGPIITDLHENVDYLIFTYEDLVLPNNDVLKIIRTYTILDWCTGVNKQYEQIIKIAAPPFEAPEDKTISCGSPLDVDGISDEGLPLFYVEKNNAPFYLYGPEDSIVQIGYYEVEEICPEFNQVYVEDVNSLDACNVGTIRRNYVLYNEENGHQNIQEQMITVEQDDLLEIMVDFPADITVACNTDIAITGEPTVEISSCQLIAVAYEDQVIQLDENTQRIIRNWTIIDWCVYNEDLGIGVVEGIQNIESFCEIDSTLVWPGDTNNDGIANNFDLLNIGIGFGTTGSSRPNASITWQAQAAENWSPIFLDGTNYKHADADGNGTIELGDIIPLLLNWGNTHNFTSNDPPISNFSGNPVEPIDGVPFYVQIDSLVADEEANLSIILGDETMMAEEVYGVAFSINFDPSVVVNGSANIDISESWLGQEGENLTQIFKEFHDEGRLDVAITRYDGINMDGMGELCKLNIIIEDVIFFQNPDNGIEALQETEFYIDNIRLINVIGNPKSTVAPISTTTIVENTTAISEIQPFGTKIKAFPNPVSSQLTISAQEEIQSISVYDIKGNLITNQKLNNQQFQFNTQEWPTGIYILKVQTKDGYFIERITVAQ